MYVVKVTALQISHYINTDKFVGFEFLTAVVMKSSVFWDVMPCSSVKVNYVLEEHLHG
jgi:hypothetical protein